MNEKQIKNKNYEYLDNLQSINSESVVLDFGANIRDVTEIIFKKYKSYLFAYEPNIVCFNYMKKRFANFAKIKVFNCAVSNFSGKGHLYFHKNAKGNNDINYIEGASLRIDKDNVDINKNIEVDIIDIKKILNDYQKIDLIKIDIEGSEYKILPEIINNKNKIKSVICELHGNPDGKKIYGEPKNKKFVNEYYKLIKTLKENNLYDNWFYEWH